MLIVHGGADPIIPIEMAPELAAALGAPLIAVEGGGHSAIARDPVFANLVIRDFVRALPRGGRAHRMLEDRKPSTRTKEEYP